MAEFGVKAPGYRLPAGTHVGRVRLQVGDLDRSLAYYVGLLGLHVLDRAPGRAELGVDHTLIELHELKGARRVPRRGRHGLFHFAILLPDRASLGRILQRLEAAGIQVGMSDHAVSEALYLTDPDGLGIEIYADRPRSEWQLDANELRMATDPLDTGSLMRAAAGVPWSGMPSGTTIGHVHLHVRDLESAKRFYHDALGLDITLTRYPGALFMSAGGYHHHLGVNTWAGGSADAPREDEAQLLDWELVIPGPDAAAAARESLRAKGFDVDAATGHVADPSGTKVRF
jgi:catechol 2,3-dioxygenase